MRRSWLPALLLALVLAVGSYLRLAHLGHGDFEVDELFQYFAARSIAEGQGPRLPSGDFYLRGIDVTRLVSVSVEQLGPTELSARLPSALFGVLGLLVFAAVLWAMAGPWVAVWGTALFAMYPEAVFQSRHLRFYTYQLFWGLIALYTGWRALRAAGSAVAADRRTIIRQWIWAALTIVLLLMAARVQVVSLSILAGWGVCVVVAAIEDLWARRRNAWRTSMPLQLSTIGLIGMALLFVFRFELVVELAARSQMVPEWVLTAEGGLNPLAYYYALVEHYPVLVSFMPLLFIAAILRRPRLGIYLAIWFAVPLFLHSFVFPWKGQRFILIAVPALFAAAAIAAAWGAGALYRMVQQSLDQFSLPPGLRSGLAGLAAGVISFAALVTMPAFSRSRDMPAADARYNEWSTSAEILRSRPELRDLPVGHYRPLHALYYLGDIDFDIMLSDDSSGRPEARAVAASTAVRDNDVGVPILDTALEIRRRYRDVGSVVIGVDPAFVEVGRVNRDLYRLLVSDAEELCRQRCGSLELYYWDFSDRRADSTSAEMTSAAMGMFEAGNRNVRRSNGR